MKHLGLFAGIGGFEIAAHWAGWETISMCEIDNYCQKVLKYYFPNAKLHEDIRTTDFSVYRGGVDIITGGFPCQPYSLAGLRKGKEDSRHLWPEMLRAIREAKPKWVVGENVYGIVNWNRGLVFEEVQADLEAEGYEVQSVLLPAVSVDAPHERMRIWFVAYRADSGSENMRSKWEHAIYGHSIASNACGSGFGELHLTEESTSTRHSSWICNERIPDWSQFPTQSPICNRDDGVPFELADITFSKWRNESIKALGNAIVPQVAYEIFKVINQFNKY